MTRTVVPPRALRGRPAELGPARAADSLPDRIVKYVPAETLAFFVPVAAAIGSRRPALLAAVVVAGLIGTVGYLWLAGQRAAPDQRPLPHFFVLAGLAYLCWAVGTNGNVAALMGLDQLGGAVLLGMAVFLIPMLDEVLVRLLPRKA